MYILGLSCYYHDASAALLKDGIVVAAAQEERFTRKKHDTSFPINAVRYCLESQNISIKDINFVGFYEKPLLKFDRVLHQHLEMFPLSLKTFLNSLPNWINQKLRVLRAIRKKLKYKGDVLFLNHHLAHAASTFLASPFEKAAILTVDGVGEWTTTSYGLGQGNNIELKKEIKFPYSLGLLYSTITAYLGFKVNNAEYKVMGLSAYGITNKEQNPYYHKLKKVIDVKEDGSYRLNMDFFTFHYKNRMPSEKMCQLLDGPVRQKGSELTQRHKDISSALQMIFEEVMTKMLNHIHQITQCDNIVIAGGCGLNSAYNGKILRKTGFRNIWIQPDAGDGGTSMGIVLYIYNTLLGHQRKYILRNASLGPGFSTEEIKTFLEQNKINYSCFNNEEELVKTTARFVYNDKIVGWFQGKMEWGPRALGNRSILGNPCNPEAKDQLNLRVKHREKFRPFAPVVCQDDALKYFDCNLPIPEPTDFMLMVYPIRPQWQKSLPSVVHQDGTGRLQTIRREQNPRYYDVIKEFGRLSDIPIVINTSFNIRGEPIVCTPADAYKCMMGTGIDYLVMDKFLIKRKDNPQDIWDSKKYAKN